MNGNSEETSTFEMETRDNFDKILKAIGKMRQDFTQRLDKIETEQAKRLQKIETEQAQLRAEFNEFKTFAELQFEAVRQGLVKNYNQMDPLEAQIAENRMVIFNTKALIGELNEKVYLMSRSSEQALK